MLLVASSTESSSATCSNDFSEESCWSRESASSASLLVLVRITRTSRASGWLNWVEFSS